MVRPVSRSIYRTGRQSTKISTARGTGTSLFDSPRKRVLRGQLDDHRVRVADCGIVWILRVLAVEQVADSAKPRPLADQLRGSLDHHALQVRPRIHDVPPIGGQGSPAGLIARNCNSSSTS